MENLVVLIKPSSSLCNSSCTYCFYKDIKSCNDAKFMSFATMEKLIDEVFLIKNLKNVTFCFQGGEPLLIGIEFYKEFINYADANKSNILVSYSLQTNGILIDREFCRFFKENNFLIGISLDGIRETHNKNRFLNNTGTGSFDTVYNKIKLVERYGINFNILCVITKSLSEQVLEVYNFFKKEHFPYIQYIACLSLINKDSSGCSVKDFKKFYSDLFNVWLQDLKKGIYTSINLFDDIILLFRNQNPMGCGMCGNCSLQCVVESDGSIYPCDFYVNDNYCLGNINEVSLDKLLSGERAVSFMKEKNSLPKICYNCKFKGICNGGCKRQRHTFVDDAVCGKKVVYELIYKNYSEIENALYNINVRG
ncbi:MAG: radical SAM protein [Anaerorhabdus sp.]